MSAVSGSGAGPALARGNCDGALTDDLGWALGTLFRSYLKAAGAAFDDIPGGPRGYQVLAAAARGEQGSQQALAAHLGVDRTVMTYLLDDLQAAGLIERRPDSADRRARRITATSTGCERLTELSRRLRAAEQQVLAGLPEQRDRQAFRGLLRRLATHAGAADPAAAGPAAAHGACGIAAEISQRRGDETPPRDLT
jgi:DNA-binding MarR family transcriptional regulator